MASPVYKANGLASLYLVLAKMLFWTYNLDVLNRITLTFSGVIKGVQGVQAWHRVVMHHDSPPNGEELQAATRHKMTRRTIFQYREPWQTGTWEQSSSNGS